MKKLNLSRLMYAGYAGGSTLKGADPDRLISALARRFDVVSCYAPGLYDRELRCYQPEGDLRLRVQYRWTGNGWQYQPLAVRHHHPARRPGDVVYRPDGSFSVAA